MSSFNDPEIFATSATQPTDMNNLEAEIPFWYLQQTSNPQVELDLPTLIDQGQSGGYWGFNTPDFPSLQTPDQSLEPLNPALQEMTASSTRYATDDLQKASLILNTNRAVSDDSLLVATESPQKTTSLTDEMICQHEGCPDASRSFKSSSAFKKHMDKHLRPYTCSVQACKVNGFATPGDLRRHEREVHAAPSFLCPIASCKRHRRGFSRKDNLIQHVKRTHDQGGDAMTTPSLSSLPPATSLTETFSTGSAFLNQQSNASGLDVTSTSQVDVSTSVSSDKTSLMTKLQELEAAKATAMAKYDGDIDALKRVLSFM